MKKLKKILIVYLIAIMIIPKGIKAEELKEIESIQETEIVEEKVTSEEVVTKEESEKEKEVTEENKQEELETPSFPTTPNINKAPARAPSVNDIAPTKNGFISENGNLYYYENGVMYRSGLRDINGKTYLFDDNGVIQKGFQTVDNHLYYFGLGSFTQQKGQWHDEGGYRYYFDSTGEVYRDGLKVIAGKTYLFDNNGRALKGFQRVDNHLYYFGLGSFTQQKGKWHDEGGYRYYFDSIGEVYRDGLKIIDGKTYLFDNNGRALKGFQTVDNHLYYFGLGSFTQQKGKWHDEGGYRYYFDATGEVYRGGLKVIDGKTYLFDNNGRALKGFQRVDNHLYYFGLGSFTQQKGRFLDEDGYRYYFGTDGEVYRDGIKVVGGNQYGFDDTGKMLKGFHEIGGKLYYFGRGSFTLQKGRFLDEDGYRYYFGTDGEVYRSGIKTISGSDYLFDNNGRMQKGFQIVGNHLYYFGRGSFTQQKGRWLDEDGQRYYFDATGEVYRGGIKSIASKEYYFDDAGKLARGMKTINDNLYYFGFTNGDMQKDAFYIENGKYKYYFGPDGVAYRGGLKEVNGNQYYFENNSEIFKGIKYNNGNINCFGIITGIKQFNKWYNLDDNSIYYVDANGNAYINRDCLIGGDWYRFGADGKLKTGWQEINGHKYYFYANGVKAKNICIINGNEYHFDSTGIFQYIQYTPRYYNQKDPNWSEFVYGLSTLGHSGCAPTSMAMAFSAILERTILPPDVAYYLYNYTNEYNKISSGTGGMAIRYAAEHYGIKWRGISNLADLDMFLKQGAIVFAAMGNGHYGTPNWNHAIVLHRYQNGYTYVSDPLDFSKSGYLDTSTIWRERSTDSDDLRGGYAFYALFK